MVASCGNETVADVRLRLLATIAVAAAMSFTGQAHAATTGGVAPTNAAQPISAPTGGGPSGGVTPGQAKSDPDPDAGKKKKRKKKRVVRARVVRFALTATRLYDEGAPIELKFAVRSKARVGVVLLVSSAAGKQVKRLDLGKRLPGDQTVELNGDRLGLGGSGVYRLQLVVRDRHGRRAVRAASVRRTLGIVFARHRFPIVGKFTFGGGDALFGAPRAGHIHQGQDLTADEGTPLVAPHAGTISTVAYQASGAGYYVVLASDNEDRDYVFMHLQRGSTVVREGQHVSTGELLGRVGATGAASGPHLHFEIWTDGHWFAGGHAIDPRPILEQWLTANNASE